jgi:beta-glucosidase
MEEKIKELLSQMTLDEKISILAGADLWNTIPIPRLGVPSIRMTDGPNGARGTQGSMAPTSVDTPVGVALGATWNPELVYDVGKVLAEETRAKGAHILLGPTVNIHRSPLAGRNFECYSEDPYLTGQIAIAYINGLQSQGVGACIKHFVCNDSEFERTSLSSEVAERPLREIYLRPFEIAIKEAKPWSLMSSYNRVNGIYSSENTYTLLDILKGEWGFDGSVISDWLGTYSPLVNPNGLDLEMPGPARWTSRDKVLTLLDSGELSEAMIDDKVRRILRTIIRVGGYERPGPLPEKSVNKPEHRQVMLRAATESIVLLKNDGGLLPFDLTQIKTIAVIGQNASSARIMGGGSSSVTPHYVVAPLEGIIKHVGDAARVEYRIGTTIDHIPPLLDANLLYLDGEGEPTANRHGLKVELFNNSELSGEPVETLVIDRTDITWTDQMLLNVDPKNFSARLSADIIPLESGDYTLSLEGSGICRLFIEGKLLVDSWTPHGEGPSPWSTEWKQEVIWLEAGKKYPLMIEFASQNPSPWRVLRIGCQPPVPLDSIEQAIALARNSDVVVLFAGLSSEWESEGFDRADMELRGAQVQLIEKVVAANPRTAVVLNTGSPVTMPWLDKVPVVLEAWYAGQEAGNAIASVLFGAANPSGKLPTTFPKRLQDTPAYINYPGENGKVYYGEGLFVGYRYYELKDVEPHFPYGHGLSYTTFEYRNFELDAAVIHPGEQVQVSLEVANTGKRTGQEVVQIYVRDLEARLARPLKELKAFTKIELDPGEVKQVSFTLNESAFAFYDPSEKSWVVEAGKFEILAGSSSRDIRLSATLEIEGKL